MKGNHLAALLLLVMVLLPARGQAQSESRQEIGIPFPEVYYEMESGQDLTRNWDVIEDQRGIIYLANRSGLLTFDGERWSRIPLTLQDTTVARTVRSLSIDDAGTVYIGMSQDFGRLQADSTGTLYYESLLPYMQDDVPSFGSVWSSFTTDAGTFFQARSGLWRWDGEALRFWEKRSGFHTAHAVGNRVFVMDFEEGLLELVGDSLRAVPNNDVIERNSAHAILPFPDGRILIATTRRLYLYDNRDLVPFPTEADAFFDEDTIYTGTVLPNGVFAFGTSESGVVLLDANGRVLRMLRPGIELPDGYINRVYGGRGGELWVGYYNGGVHRFNVRSPVTYFDEKVGLDGLISDVVRHDGTLYVGTGSGLYRLASEGDRGQPQFEQVDDVPYTHDLEPSSYGLLASTGRGLYRIVDGTIVDVLHDGATQAVEVSQVYPGRIYSGRRRGVHVLEDLDSAVTEDAWQRVPGPEIWPTDLLESPDGALWVNHYSERYRIQFEDGDITAPNARLLDSESGLPDRLDEFFNHQGALYAALPQGFYRYEEDGDKRQFVPDSTLTRGIDVEGDFHQLLFPKRGNWWLAKGDHVFRAPPPRNAASPQWTPVEALTFEKSRSVSLHVDDDGILWVTDLDRLYRYDPNVPPLPSAPFEALVRSVTSIADESVIYGGAPLPADRERMRIPNDDNDLQFDVAAPLHDTIEPHVYQFYLEGQDTGWSDWMSRTQVTYTDLFEGAYTLRVRARNERGEVSQEGTFAFRIAPPWYRTVWAYGVYLIGFVVMGVGVRKYYSVLAENERQRERTQMLESEQRANERLKRANRLLKQSNELKETFFASMSHELRTPLTNILGFADILAVETSKQTRPHVSVITENGHRLLQTLDALLDLASLRAGEMKPSIERVNVCQVVEDVALKMRKPAQIRGLDLHSDVPATAIYAMLDRRYLMQILENLLDNAIKFTPEGSVDLRLAADVDTVSIAVTDTGIGIREGFIPDLFRDFKQESDGLTRTYDGTGLGLAITARLVDLMDGAISVRTKKGEGSTFTVRFPRRQPVPRSPRQVTISA